jgi:hypothetical protein
VPIDATELAKRLAEADRTRVTLRKATLELVALGREILKQRERLETENGRNRSDGSDRGPSGDRAGLY